MLLQASWKCAQAPDFLLSSLLQVGTFKTLTCVVKITLLHADVLTAKQSRATFLENI